MAFPIAAALAIAAEAAPFIAKHLFGERAADATEKVVSGALAVTGARTPEEALAALRADSAAKLAFQTRMSELDAEMERLAFADIANARARDVAIRQSGGGNWRADALAILVVAGLIGMAGALLFFEPPAGAGRDLLLLLAGALVNAFAAVVAYEFGSSRGSKVKDAAIALIKNGSS